MVGTILDVDVLVYDPDGDTLEFEIGGLPTTAEATATLDGVHIHWAPLANEAQAGGTSYPVRLVARDGAGASVEALFEIVAYPDGGVPVFLTPPGVVLDLSKQDRLSLVVEVKDDDSPLVEFSVIENLPGAKWNQIDDRNHTLTWIPTAEQIAEKPYWPLVLGAKDETHPTVVQVIAVFLANAYAMHECPGTWPLLYDFDASLDSGGLVQFVGVSWDPETPIRSVTVDWISYDDNGYELLSGQTPLLSQGTNYVSSVSQFIFGEGAALVEYAVRVRDDDDLKSTLCDHETRHPKEGHFTLTIKPGTCPSDAFGSASGGELSVQSGSRTSLRMCPGATRTLELSNGITDALEFVAMSPEGESIHVEVTGMDKSNVLATADGVGVVSLVRAPVADSGPVRVHISRPFATQTGQIDAWIGIHSEPCQADLFEPDNSPEEALTIFSANQQSRVLCPGDEDWIRLNLSQDGVVTVLAEFPVTGGDLDLDIIDALDGFILRRALSRTDNERFEVGLESGSYYLRMRSPRSQNKMSYQLTVNVDIGGICLEDIYAPNFVQEEGPVMPESYLGNLVLCSGASDYFSHTVNQNESYHVEVDRKDGGAQHLPIAVLNSEGTVIESAQGVLQTDPLGSGTYSIKVSGLGTQKIPYTLYFQVTNHQQGCPTDRFSPNQSPETSVLLSDGWTTRLLLCPGEIDFFSVKIPAAGPVRILAFYATPSEPVALERVDGNGVVLEVGDNEGPWAVLDTTLPSAGTHGFRVRNQGGATFYDLQIEFP